MEIITRKEARELGLKRYFTGKRCKHGHISERIVSNACCIICVKIRQKKYYDENPTLFKQKSSDWKTKNPEKNNKKSKEWYWKNVEKAREAKRREYHKDPEKARKRRKEQRLKTPERTKEVRSKSFKKYSKTAAGQLRAVCKTTIDRLKRKLDGRITRSKCEIIDYSAEEFELHLLSSFPEFKSIKEAKENGYEIDHKIPLKFIAEYGFDLETSYLFAMDLKNLQLLKSEDNRSKRDKFYVEENKDLFMELHKKYIGG